MDDYGEDGEGPGEDPVSVGKCTWSLQYLKTNPKELGATWIHITPGGG